MSMNLIHINRNVDQMARAAADWAAITAISNADASSPYPTEGYVHVSAEAVKALATLLDGARLGNGASVRTYDFSCEEDGRVEAHVSAFGPSMLSPVKLAGVRAILATFPSALAMVEEVVSRRLQISFSTETLDGRENPHGHAVNWPADVVEVRCSGTGMHGMLRRLGLGEHVDPETDDGSGEVTLDAFASAVRANAGQTGMAETLHNFLACACRNDATHVYWA